MEELGLRGVYQATDLWFDETFAFSDSIYCSLRPHAAVLYKIHSSKTLISAVQNTLQQKQSHSEPN
jgi:hypothetical protein